MAQEIDVAHDLIEMGGYWWPHYDAEYPSLPHALMRNVKDIAVSAAVCKRRRLCVQAGGNVGIWPIALTFMFDRVVTLEPQPAAFQALCRNAVREISSGRMSAQLGALGAAAGTVRLQAGQNSATWRKVEEHAPLFPQMDAQVFTIDGLGHETVDAIYLDVEGAELDALKGADQTIKRCRPVLHLEVFDKNRADLEAYVFGLGYKFIRTVHKDSIYVPGK